MRPLSASLSLLVVACAGAAREPAFVPAPVRTLAAEHVVVPADPPAEPPQHWYFEWLSQDGKRALLRRLDGSARAALQTRVVDVDTGATLLDETFPELAKLPQATIGRKPNEIAELMGTLASPAFTEDLVRAARVAEDFPFGSYGRLSASPHPFGHHEARQGGAISFNAGDWLYVADATGHVRKRLSTGAAYDPRFTADGKSLLFRRATGTIEKGVAKYELFVVPTDLSSAPRVLPGTAGARDRFSVDAERGVAVAVASHEPQIKTCVFSIGLRPPFSVKRNACLDGGEPFVESILSPNGRWAAVTTQKSVTDAHDDLEWRLRVVSVTSGKVVMDEKAEPGSMVRAISDSGLLVQSGARGVVVDDVEAKTRRTLARAIELGHRGFFRSPSELVVVRGSSVAVIDLAKE